MKFNVLKPVIDYQGKSVLGDNKKDYLYKDAIFVAMNSFKPGENIDNAVKMKLFEITIRMYNSKDGIVDFSSEEITLIKERTGFTNGPLVLGRMAEFLDNPVAKSEDKSAKTK